jgi:translation initiation factor 1A
MPRVKKKARGGAKLRKKRKQQTNAPKRRLRRKDFGEEYAQVRTAKGNCRFDVLCSDNVVRLAHIRGSMRRTRIFPNDVILVSLRLFEKEDTKCDIVHKYKPEEIAQLFQIGAISQELAQIDVLQQQSSDDGDDHDDHHSSHNSSDRSSSGDDDQDQQSRLNRDLPPGYSDDDDDDYDDDDTSLAVSSDSIK